MTHRTFAKAIVAGGSTVFSFFCRVFFALRAKNLQTEEIRGLRKTSTSARLY